METTSYELSINALPISIALYKKDEDGDFIFFDFNKTAEDIDGISKEDLIGHKVTEIFPGILEMGLIDIFNSVYDTGITQTYDKAYYQDERMSGWRKNTLSMINDHILMAVYEDISIAKEFEDLQDMFASVKGKNNNTIKEKTAQLMTEKSKYEALLKNATDAIFIMDLEGGLVEYSDKVKDFLGYDDDELKTITVTDWDRDLSSFQDFKDIVSVLSHEPVTIERVHSRKDGTTYIASITASKTMAEGKELIYCAVRDITEEKNAQKKLIQQSRLAQMGEMLSMIAHQWRQPLSAISAITIGLKIKSQLLKLDSAHKKEFEEYLDYEYKRFSHIEALILSLSATIDDFRNFFKKNKKYESITWNVPLDNALKILQPSLDAYGIELTNNYTCNNKVMALSNELTQVIINVLKNSLDNFLEKQVADPKIIIACDCTDDHKLSLKIYDNGGGISENILENIFDPYFSTKEDKNGTGLGLYMSKIIIEEHHHGKLIVENTNEGVCSTIEMQTNLT